MNMRLSKLSKTWIFDLDGTLVEHNGCKNGGDILLPGVKAFLKAIPRDDRIVIVTSRKSEVKGQTERFLKENNVLYHAILFDMPQGERILFNDDKPSGLKMAYAVNLPRDYGLTDIKVIIDENL